MIWEFGIVPLILMAVFPTVYITGRLVRNFGAWMQRDEQPKERFRIHIIIAVILGLAVGGFLQPYYNCYLTTHSIYSCIT
jgi:hypothetical protein